MSKIQDNETAEAELDNRTGRSERWRALGLGMVTSLAFVASFMGSEAVAELVMGQSESLSGSDVAAMFAGAATVSFLVVRRRLQLSGAA